VIFINRIVVSLQETMNAHTHQDYDGGDTVYFYLTQAANKEGLFNANQSLTCIYMHLYM